MRLDRPILLENAAQHYAWGLTDAIPKLFGQKPDGRPVAELWIGAHPQLPSQALVSGRRIPLDRLIVDHAEEALGPTLAAGSALPFLFKVLAAAAPLSLQCHPNAEQAQQGYAREEQAGIARDAAQRCYRDPNPKPEMVVALTPFHVLKGFRAPADICAAFTRVPHPGLEAAVELLSRNGDLRAFMTTLWKVPVQARGPLVVAVAARGGTVGLLAARYRDDVMALSPLFLHELTLKPGEGMFLGPCELHAYLSGTALEIMGNSDNVLRGGLTNKHVDVGELLRVVEFKPNPPTVITASNGELASYQNPSGVFTLAKTRSAQPVVRGQRSGPDIALCLEGQARLKSAGGELELSSGQSALIPHAAGDYQVSGSSALWIAGVPASV